jgi:hypothetical protein
MVLSVIAFVRTSHGKLGVEIQRMLLVVEPARIWVVPRLAQEQADMFVMVPEELMLLDETC